MSTKYRFESYHGRELTIAEARAEAGEFSREAHDLCCWPLKARPYREQADALFAEINRYERAEARQRAAQ